MIKDIVLKEVYCNVFSKCKRREGPKGENIRGSLSVPDTKKIAKIKITKISIIYFVLVNHKYPGCPENAILVPFSKKILIKNSPLD